MGGAAGKTTETPAAYLRSRGVEIVAGRVAAVAAAAAEYRALAEGALLVPLLDRTVLRLTGADRHDFLHGQVSNEVRGLAVGACNEALLLNHKGHALAQLAICRRSDDLVVTVEGGRGGLVERSLREHIVFDQVVLEDLGASLVALALQGAAAGRVAAALGPPPEAGAFSEVLVGDAKVLVRRARRSAPGGFDLLLLARDLAPLVARLEAEGAVLAGEDALELSRVEAGVPRAEREAGEGVLPQEAGLEALVSYRKGCYLGQEIMARIEARGRVRRSLQGLVLDALPSPGADEVRLEGRPVGRLGTAVDHPELGMVALAVLRRDLPAGAALEVGGSGARAVALPFGRGEGTTSTPPSGRL